MKLNCISKNSTVNLSLTGLMAALVLVATYFFKIQIATAGGGKTMLGFANVFCILSGLLLGPVYGGLAAGIGSCLFDLLGGWASSAPVTLVTKFAMAFLCGWIVWAGKEGNAQKLPRLIVGAVTGSLSYCVLYIATSWLEAAVAGNPTPVILAQLATKIPVTLVNAALADVIAIPLFLAIRRALKRSRISFG